jgi:hypothetical protein
LHHGPGITVADYRLEVCPDPETGLYFVQVFHPSTAVTAVTRTKPIYRSMEEAQRKVGESIAAAIAKTPQLEWKAIVFDNT